MENGKRLRRTAYIALVWVLIAVIAVSGATYAWFTFFATTNVTPIRGRIGGGKTLLISANPDGPFRPSCDLVLSDEVTLLEPVSTANLTDWYAAAAQSYNGITDLFYRVENPYSRIMHGYVYILCEDEPSEVYLFRDGFEVGGTPIVWASGRLGMRITTRAGSYTRVFALDELGDTSGADALHTVNGEGVISGVSRDGYASFAPDPAQRFAPFFATGSEDEPVPGDTPLFTIEDGETVRIEYFVWLEGCDDNCLEGVFAGDMSLELAFVGV